MEHIYLSGSEAVERAASSIANSVELMQRAMLNFQAAVDQHERVIRELIDELRAAPEEKP